MRTYPQQNEKETWELVVAVTLALAGMLTLVRCTPAEMQHGTETARNVKGAMCAVVRRLPIETTETRTAREICNHADSTESEIRAALQRCILSASFADEKKESYPANAAGGAPDVRH